MRREGTRYTYIYSFNCVVSVSLRLIRNELEQVGYKHPIEDVIKRQQILLLKKRHIYLKCINVSIF